MADANLSTAQGWVKTIYGKVEDAVPDNVFLLDMFPFAGPKNGGDHADVIWFSSDHGATYDLGTNGDSYALNASIPAESRPTASNSPEIIMRTEMGVGAIARAVQKGEAAFGAFWTQGMKNLKNAMAKRQELALLYGGDDLGIVSGTPSGSAGARVITLTAQSWVPMAWLGAKNARIDVYASSTKRNATTDIVITAVDPVARTLAVTGAEAELAAIVSTDQIYLKGTYGNQVTGLSKICGLTAGDSYLGIAVNDFPDLWSATNYDCSGAALTFAKVQAGLALAAGRGGITDHDLLVSHTAWNDLADDMAALRVVDSSYSKDTTEYGTKALRYYTATGTVSVKPSLWVKEGEAYAIPLSGITRKGASEITFKLPGLPEGKDGFFLPRPDNAGVELRCFSSQRLHTNDVTSCIRFHNIT